MQTPSLGRRVVLAGVAAVALLAVCLDVLLVVSLRSTLAADARRELEQAATIAASEVRRLPLAALHERLRELGVDAAVWDSDGNLVGNAASGPVDRAASRDIRLPDGSTATIALSRPDADRSLRRLVRLELIVTPLVVLLALFLLRLISDFALRPLDRIAAAARRTAEGRRGERLRPDRTDTRLGQMAAAYDGMLDALERALGDAETAHAEAEVLLERNRRIIETAREAFVAVDDSGLIVDWNAEAERIFGWPREEAIGRPVAGTILASSTGGDGDDGLPFGTTGAPERVDRVVEFSAVHRDGHRFPARMTVWSTAHAGSATVSAFIWDVTVQLQAEQAVAQLAAVVESADDAMLSTSLDGTILTWNPAATRMFGYRPEEVVGRHVHLLVPGYLQEEDDLARAAIGRNGPVQRFPTLRLERNGAVVEVAMTMSPVKDAAGVVSAVASTARDITEERWIATQLDYSLRALEEALEEARASEAETRRFLDDAAHQLRAPMTSIRACAEGLLRTNDPVARDELLGAVIRETTRAGRLMTGLLRMARLSHAAPAASVPCDVVQLCRAEADRVGALQQQDIPIAVTAEGAVDRLVLVDPHAMGEIVANLLDNARRHARERIDVTVVHSDDLVEVVIRDDGPGLSPEQVEVVFDRFVSLDGRGGSGLGLPIARELARMQGGELEYEQRSFVVRIPAAAVQDDHPHAGPMAGHAPVPVDRS